MPSKYWKYSILLSLWVVTNIFWPNFDTRNAEYIAWQFGCVAIFALSHLFQQVRKSENMAPGLFLIFAMISVFTHGIHPVYLEGLTQVIMFCIAFYSIINTTEESDVVDIKKAIVLIAVVNVLFGLTQQFGMRLFFDTNQVTGFIGQKWNFGIFCALALPFALEWNLGIALFVLVGVVMADKYAIYIPVFFSLFVNQKIRLYPKKFLIPILIILALVAVTFKTNGFRVNPDFKDVYHTELNGAKGEIDIKFKPRIQHWIKMTGYCFARPLDGWGLNSYANHVWSKDRPGQVEMHNEWLNMFFEAGLFGLAIIFGWFNYIRRRSFIFNMDDTTNSLFIVLLSSFFHSTLHSPNILFVFMFLMAVWEIEKGAWFPYGQAYPVREFEQPQRSFSFNQLLKRLISKNKSCDNGDRCPNDHAAADRG